jgi:flagellar M-ring protein FliF
VAYTRMPAGRLQRLSAAVVIDNLRTTGADGKPVETPLTEEQIARINTLVRDAVGFDEARGDRVSVVNQSFLPDTTTVPEIDKPSLLDNPLLRDIAKLLSGVIIVALLLLLIVRPLIKNLMGGNGGVKALAQAVGGPLLLAEAPAGAEDGANRPATVIAYEQQIAQARSIVAKDPARVAQVVKEWVQKDE